MRFSFFFFQTANTGCGQNDLLILFSTVKQNPFIDSVNIYLAQAHTHKSTLYEIIFSIEAKALRKKGASE